MQPLINGTAYSWSQITVNIFNTRIAGITAISYEDMQDMEDNYGAGNNPVSRGYGKRTSKASMTLEMAEVEALQAATVDGSLQSIPEFDIVVSYLPEGGVIRNHTLHNCKFKSNKRDVKTGDMAVNVELEMLISHITWKS